MLGELFNADTDRGQVGIGTLIVFIAMVLVAAVAAGVLVNTAGLLQGQSETTGQDAQAEVSNNIDVVSANGDVDSSSGQVTAIELVTKKSAGSDALDLESATIQYSSSDTSTTLLHGAETSDATTLTNNATEFGTENVDTSAGASNTVLADTEDRITVVIDAGAVDTSGGLDAGETATLRVVDQSGATKTVELNVPPVTSDKSSVQL